jgi:hypothetical protein
MKSISLAFLIALSGLLFTPSSNAASGAYWFLVSESILGVPTGQKICGYRWSYNRDLRKYIVINSNSACPYYIL